MTPQNFIFPRSRVSTLTHGLLAIVLALPLALAMAFALAFVTPQRASADCGGTGKKVDVTNQGTEFYIVFQANEEAGYTFENYQELYFASLGDSTTITVTITNDPTWSKSFHLQPKGSLIYRVSDDKEVIVNSNEIPDSHVLHVNATRPIICYGMNHKARTSDAFLALPKGTAGVDFRVLSYNSSSADLFITDYPSEFTVIAVEDNTSVTIIPSCRTRSQRPAGTPIIANLKQGQCFQVQAYARDSASDLTGSVVTSDKPIMLFGGHVRAEVPVGYERSDGGTSRNHLCEIVPPTTTWGRTFAVSNFKPRTQGDVTRVLVLEDNTKVMVDGVLTATLAANKFIDLIVKQPSLIETSGPAVVGEYAFTQTENFESGDPFFVVIPPMEQTFNDFPFFVRTDSVFDQQYLNVAFFTPLKDKLRLDGNPLPKFTPFADLPATSDGRKYSMATISVPTTTAVHRIAVDGVLDSGLTIVGYGFGDVDGYGYTAGALLKPIRSIAQVKNTNAGIVSDPNTISFRNMLTEFVYLDSVKVEVDEDPMNIYGVRVKENVALDISRVGMSEIATLHLTASHKLSTTLKGKLTLYNHSGYWHDLDHPVFDFTVVPESALAVADGRSVSGGQSLLQGNYPNPVSQFTNVELTMPRSGQVSLQLYDQIGRPVKQLFSGLVSTGQNSLRVERGDLPAGYYFYELSAPALGVKERRALIITD